MSDAKTLNLTSLVTKKTRRAKARLMQNFGKADKTTDELFEVYQLNFNRQQSTALNLQKHVKHYMNCLKELHEASRSVSQCLIDMHERDWPKHDVFENNLYEMEHINEDLQEKLKESVLVPLEQYLGQFSEMREKISKRGRKLVDYDSQRHTFEAIQHHQAGKQSDDTKLIKSRDQLEEARRVYETLNNELHEELPALYDNRLPFIITVFQRLFQSKITYHEDNVTINKNYLGTVKALAAATEEGGLNSVSGSSYYTQQNQNKLSHTALDKERKQLDAIGSGAAPETGVAIKTNSNGKNKLEDNSKDHSEKSVVTHHADAPSSIDDKEPVYLHKVRATYKYLAEDEDELSFEAGEIIQVIEYDDPQEQEEGWLMGIKESTKQKGLFPANFTKEL